MPFAMSEAIEVIQEGIPDAREAWDCFKANRDFFEMRNRLYLELSARREAETPYDWDMRPKQYSRLTRRAVRCLTAKMYAPGPTRHVDDAAWTDLEPIYQECRIDSVMQVLDQLATLDGYAAVQATATGNPDKPIRLYVWGAEEFWPLFASDDPLEPACLITKSVVPGIKKGTKRRKFQVWTAEQYETWYSKDFNPMDVSTSRWEGVIASIRDGGDSGPNPYGVIPFAYAWNQLPVDRFFVDGIGGALREANQEVDRMLTDLAQLIAVYNRPKGFVRNVSSMWREAERIGSFTRLPSSGDKDETHGPPEPFYLQPTVDVISSWEHIHNYIDETFTDLDIPIQAARGSARLQGSMASGVALAIQNQPLRDYLQARQVQFGFYERGIGRMISAVYGAYYGVPAAWAAATTLDIDLEWSEIALGPATAEEDQHDQWCVDNGLDSATTVLMRQRGWSREQAEEHLEQVAKDRLRERDLFATLTPEPLQQATQGQQQPTDQPQAEPTDPNAMNPDDMGMDD